jgi:hypothetical protein
MRRDCRHTSKALLLPGVVLVVLAGLWALLVASVIGEAKKTSTEGTIYKSRSAGITVNHFRHTGELGLDCTACHKGASQSKESADFLVPGHETCLGCHAEAVCTGDLEGPCLKCHAKKPVSLTTLKVKHKGAAEVVFPHKKHLAGKAGKGKCLACHVLEKKSGEKNKKNDPGLPGMKNCIACHTHTVQYDAFLCTICHFKEKEGTLVKKLKNGALLKPPSWMAGIGHDAAWYKQHEISAGSDASLCATCHTNQDCDACHAGTGKARPELIHPDDWIQMHGYSSLAGDLHCASCHTLQSFCLPCHRRSGVAWDSPSGLNVPPGSLLHPEGWYSFPGSGGSSLHAKEAKKSLSSCVACHTEYDCMTCHSAPLPDFNPHPPSSVWLKKCGTLYSKNPSVCLKCHAPGSPELLQCD